MEEWLLWKLSFTVCHFQQTIQRILDICMHWCSPVTCINKQLYKIRSFSFLKSITLIFYTTYLCSKCKHNPSPIFSWTGNVLEGMSPSPLLQYYYWFHTFMKWESYMISTNVTVWTFNYKMASCLLSWREKSLGITTIWFLKPLGLNPGTIILLTVFRFKSVLHSTQSWERLYLSRQNYRSYKTYCSMLVQFLNSHVSETDLYHSCSDLQVDKSPSADSDKGSLYIFF